MLVCWSSQVQPVMLAICLSGWWTISRPQRVDKCAIFVQKQQSSLVTDSLDLELRCTFTWTPCCMCRILLVSWKLGWAGSKFLEREKEVHTSQKNVGSHRETWVILNVSWTLLIPSWIHVYLFTCSLFYCLQIRSSSITIACIELRTNQCASLLVCSLNMWTRLTQYVLWAYLSLHRRWSSVWACWLAKGDICPAPTCLLGLAG